MSARNDGYGRDWILKHAIPIVNSYAGLTLRQLYYRLVSMENGLPNTLNHYKRVGAAMTEARWDGKVQFDQFIDRDRSMIGRTRYERTAVDSAIETAMIMVQHYMTSYSKNRWENQEYYLETWIEKNALVSVFQSPVTGRSVALGPCKGYPSLTFLHDAKLRFSEARDRDKRCILLYFGDYDPSGQDIPRSIEENLRRMGCRVTVEHKMLHPEQIEELGLPGVPAKHTDSRTACWDGEACVELDAVEPDTLGKMAREFVMEYLDDLKWKDLKKQEEQERKEYVKRMKQEIAVLDVEFDDDEDNESDGNNECYYCGEKIPADEGVEDEDGDHYCNDECLKEANE